MNHLSFVVEPSPEKAAAVELNQRSPLSSGGGSGNV